MNIPKENRMNLFRWFHWQWTFFTITGCLGWFWNEQSELKQSCWVFLSGNWNVRFSADSCWPHSQMWYSPWHFNVLMKSRDDLNSCFIFHKTLMANSAPWPQSTRWPKCSLGSVSTPFIASGQSLSWRTPSQLEMLQPFPSAGDLLFQV